MSHSIFLSRNDPEMSPVCSQLQRVSWEDSPSYDGVDSHSSGIVEILQQGRMDGHRERALVWFILPMQMQP